jgi:hypothetical protein
LDAAVYYFQITTKDGEELYSTNKIIGVQQSGLKVYPNPTNGELRVESGELRVENVEIFDVMGRKVQSFEFKVQSSEFSNFKPETLNISHLPTGIYFIRILTYPPSEGLGEAEVIVQKIIKR